MARCHLRHTRGRADNLPRPPGPSGRLTAGLTPATLKKELKGCRARCTSFFAWRGLDNSAPPAYSSEASSLLLLHNLGLLSGVAVTLAPTWTSDTASTRCSWR